MVQGGGAASPRPGLWVAASGRSRSPTNRIGKLAASRLGPLIARLAAKAHGWSGRSGFSGALSAGALRTLPSLPRLTVMAPWPVQITICGAPPTDGAASITPPGKIRRRPSARTASSRPRPERLRDLWMALDMALALERPSLGVERHDCRSGKWFIRRIRASRQLPP